MQEVTRIPDYCLTFRLPKTTILRISTQKRTWARYGFSQTSVGIIGKTNLAGNRKVRSERIAPAPMLPIP